MHERTPLRAVAPAGLATLLVAATPLLSLAAAGADPDGYYEQPIGFWWATPDIDVLIVAPERGPVESAQDSGDSPLQEDWVRRYRATFLAAANDWGRAVDAFAAPWLRDGLRLNAYLATEPQSVPPTALADPEIVVVVDATKDGPLWHIYGVAQPVGTSTAVSHCVADVGRLAREGTGAGTRYVPYSQADMYDVAAHEIGHCLGLMHVNHGEIMHDTMDGVPHHAFGLDGTHLHCMSSLNVRGLEYSFGPVLGHAPASWIAQEPVGAYQTIDC